MTGDKGIALIHRIVNDIGFVWNPLHLEAGIDGVIEVRDAMSGDVTNCIIQVQSKAGGSYFRAETDTTFEFICDERDLVYWLGGNAPVILVVSRPGLNEAYWISLKHYFSDPALRKSRKITFSKSRDQFTLASRERLAAIALPENSGLYLTATPKPDVLFTNLLPVSDFPKRLFCASTKLRYPSQVWDRLNVDRDSARPEWLLHDGMLYSFHDLTFAPWTGVCTSSTTENLRTTDFAWSPDSNKRYVFVRMLQACMYELLYRQGVRYSKLREHYYFRSTLDLSEIKVGGLSVFKAYFGKKVKDKVMYYRHRAAELSFDRYDKQWYVEITPSYHFTRDGWKLSRYFDDLMTGIKQRERQNKTHLRQVRLWEQVLCQDHVRVPEAEPSRQKSLFAESELDPAVPPALYTMISFDRLVQFDVDWNIPESAWLPQRTTGAEDDADTDQRSLFE